MTLVRPDDPSIIRDARLQGLYRYWLDKRGDREMPSRADVDPIEMKTWLGNLVLVDFPEERMQYRIRLDGVNIVQFYGSSRQGRGVEVMTSEDERRIVLPQWWIVLDHKLPAYFEAQFQTSEGIPTHQYKLLLPLSDDGKRVTMILAGIYFDQMRISAAR